MAWRGSISRSMIAAGRSSSIRSPPVSLPRHLPSPPSAAPRLQHRRSLGELGSTQSLLPMFSMAAAGLTSHLSVSSRACCELSQGTFHRTCQDRLNMQVCGTVLASSEAPSAIATSVVGCIPQPCLGYMAKQENKLHMCREIETSCTGFLKSGFVNNLSSRCISSTTEHFNAASLHESSISSPGTDHPPRIKFKRLDKTAKNIMNILDKESVEKVQTGRLIPDIQPGYIIQIKVEVPENKRRVSTYKGIVIARRNAGLNTTFRLRGMIAGVSFESVYLLYSPNIKEVKVIDKKKVRRAKLYYLRDRLNPLKK